MNTFLNSRILFSARLLLAMILPIASTKCAVTQDLTPAELQAIARDAYIYGSPIVENYHAMRAEAIDGTWSVPLIHSASELAKNAKPEGSEAIKPTVLQSSPNPEMERPTIWGEPTEVQIGMLRQMLQGLCQPAKHQNR